MMNSISVLLVDDEPAANRRMAGLLATYPEIRITQAVCSLREAQEAIFEDRPELVFLDVEMEGKSGMDLVPLIAEDIKVIFVTGHDRFAVRAFELCAFDYLLKPVTSQRLELTIARWVESRKYLSKASLPSPGHELPGKRYLLPVSATGGDMWVAADEILWIEALQNYTRIQLSSGEVATLKRSLGEWEALLCTADYLRLDRSLLIRHGALRSRKWESRDRTVLFFEGVSQPLVIGRTAAVRLKELEG